MEIDLQIQGLETEHSSIYYGPRTTRVVNIKDGFPSGAIYIGRAGKGQDGYFGNPFTLEKDGDRNEILHKYREWIKHRIGHDDEFRARVAELKGKTLVCFCIPKKCHGMVLAAWADIL